MHYTLHLTDRCSMRCDYCYVAQRETRMSASTARRVIDSACESGDAHVGIAFFGGEPLLCKDIIEETIAYARRREADCETRFSFKVTTNGLHLDEAFLRYASTNRLMIALSCDGVQSAHDRHRRTHDGDRTHDRVMRAARLLLTYQPNAPVMLTVNPDTLGFYAESVEALYSAGFVFILCAMNYAAAWHDGDMAELEKQYKKLARFYIRHTLAEDAFYLSPFESKIESHVCRETYCSGRCHLAEHQVAVGPDGTVYPCMQFVGEPRCAIGDVHSGIDGKRRLALLAPADPEDSLCSACAVRERCNHYCACQNKLATGFPDQISPALCRHEQILIPIADRVAERLYKKRSALFIQKHYNEFYPLLSLVSGMS